jgi:hypothetical protein
MAWLVGSSRVAGPYHRSGIAPCPEGSRANLPLVRGESVTGVVLRALVERFLGSARVPGVGPHRQLERRAFQAKNLSPHGTGRVPSGEIAAAWNAGRSGEDPHGRPR